MSTNQEILSTPAAARTLGVRPQTLRAWRHYGYGPRYIRLGRGMRSPAGYRSADLQAWLELQTFNSTSEESVRAGGEG